MEQDNWYAIVREETGQLESVGSVVASVLPLGLIKIPLSGPPNSDEVWDQRLQKFVVRPEKTLIDRMDDFNSSVGVSEALNTLTPSDRQAIKDAIIKILGRRRYRASEASNKL